jgi:phenylacetate-CoA ligase
LLLDLTATSEFYRGRTGVLNLERNFSLNEFYAQVPILSRFEFKNCYTYILSSDYKNQKVVKSNTSGTTGMAIQFYHTDDDQVREWAAICHQWKRAGYLPGVSRRAEFRGLTSFGLLVEKFPQQNMIRCSILNLKKQHIIYYAEEIRKNKIDFYHGYPSAIYLLASEIIHNKIDFPQPKAVLLASEIVYDWQVAQIQKAFPNTFIYSHYGCAERTVLAGWCEHRREYHVLPQYGLVEIDEKNSEIIGTNLYNSVNGFVRYRMTDTVLKVDYTICPACHRPYTPRLIELGGRTEDFLFSLENGWIPPAIVTYPLKSLKVIREVQFFQKERAEICLRYTTLRQDDDLLKHDLDVIKTGLHHIFGTGMSFKFEPVEGFQRGPTGKFKWVICELEEMPSK